MVNYIKQPGRLEKRPKKKNLEIKNTTTTVCFYGWSNCKLDTAEEN